MSTDTPPTSPQAMRIRANHAQGVTDVRVLMTHPMETGQRHDTTGQLVPAHFITEVQAHHVGAQGAPRLVLRTQWSTAIAQNPILFFKFKGGAPGDKIVLHWVDNLGVQRSDEAVIR